MKVQVLVTYIMLRTKVLHTGHKNHLEVVVCSIHIQVIDM